MQSFGGKNLSLKLFKLLLLFLKKSDLKGGGGGVQTPRTSLPLDPSLGKLKGATSRGFGGFLLQTILKLVVGSQTYAQHYLWTSIREDITLICKEKHSTAINIKFFNDARQQLEKFSLNFSSCNPFPSWPSAAKDTWWQFQSTKMEIFNKNGPLFLGFLRYIFWLFKEMLKIMTEPL